MWICVNNLPNEPKLRVSLKLHVFTDETNVHFLVFHAMMLQSINFLCRFVRQTLTENIHT
jgi:hypothetical protein